MKKLQAFTAMLLSTCLILTSCALSDNTSGKNNINNKYDIKKITSDVIDGNRDFAFKIFKELNTEDKGDNLFISPLSISTALAMTYNGARGSTKEAMAGTLSFDDAELIDINTSFKNLIPYLSNIDKKVELNINNSIWIKEGKEIQEKFLSDNRLYFNAPTESLDFSKESSVTKMNKWISDATNGKIKEMLEHPIDRKVIMYLINAIYFKGEWKQQFKKNRTYDDKFISSDGKSQDVKMMSRKGMAEYAKGEDFKVVKLPYGNGKTSMYCILPEETVKIDDFISSLNAVKWKQIFNMPIETDDVMLGLPRFKIEYGNKLLNESLISLGMEEAFSLDADFTGIGEDIFISRVLHKAVIEVNEEGSEASGVTVVEMKEEAAVEPTTFIANRPFVFLIVDDETETIFFMGKLAKIM